VAGTNLYIIQSRTTGSVKVGRSDDPERRLLQLQTGCPYTLRIILTVDDGGHLERQIHDRMRNYRTRNTHGGEWFSEAGLGEVPGSVWEHARHWYLEDPDWWKR